MQQLQQRMESIHAQHQDTRALQESVLKPTQLPGYFLINKSCKVSAYITTCYPKPELFDIKYIIKPFCGFALSFMFSKFRTAGAAQLWLHHLPLLFMEI